MAIKTKEQEFETSLGNVTIQVSQLGAIKAGLLLMRLKSKFGPPVIAVALGEQNKDPNAIGQAARDLLTSLDGDELVAITKELLTGGSAIVRHNGEVTEVWPNFDSLFTGHLESWFKLLWFALELNYGNFFAALVGPLSKMKTGPKEGGLSTLITSFGQPKG